MLEIYASLKSQLYKYFIDLIINQSIQSKESHKHNYDGLKSYIPGFRNKMNNLWGLRNFGEFLTHPILDDVLCLKALVNIVFS